MVEKTASQITDHSEANSGGLLEANLVDMQAFRDATELAKGLRQIEMEKSQGKRQSNTLDPFPMFEFKQDQKAAGKALEPTRLSAEAEQRVYDEQTGRLTSRSVKDEDGSKRYEYDAKTGKLTSSDILNLNGSWVHSEYAENGNRTVMVRNDGKGNEEKIIFDPVTGKEVASDIKFKDKSTMHVVFDPDGNVKEIASKDKDGNVNQWNRDAKENPGVVVKDVNRPYPFEGVSATEIKFPNGFKVHLDFAPSSQYVSGIWTSDRDVQGVRDVNLSSIRR